MGYHSRHRFRRWIVYIFSLVLTFLGLAFVRAGLGQGHFPPELPTILQSRMAVASSSRGMMVPVRSRSPIQQGTLNVQTVVQRPPWADVAKALGQQGGLELSALPRTEVTTYTVQPGDNLWLIAERFGISQDTLVWANEKLEMDPDMLNVGQELYILPISGVWHTVKDGETLAQIAQRYQATTDKIIGYAPNELSSDEALAAGKKLIVPDGVKPFEPHLVYTQRGAITVNARPETGRFIWPCNGVITQYFGKWHIGLDVANVMGTPVYAADGGTVTLASWWDGLGNAVRIDHGDGYVTIYGHFQTIMVKEGQVVQRGQQIGEMGSTGNSTGPHVHFVMLYYGGAVNPIRYLP